jgi:nucleotide-binding universal stress UspA family protein
VATLSASAIKHVLIALNAAQEAQRSLDAALAIAQSLGAELSGLFVEDVNLLRLAQLPFARETDVSTAASRPIESAHIKRTLQQQAAQLERSLGEAAQRLQVNWSFQVVQGELLAAALSRQADLMVLGSGLGSRTLRLPEKGATAARGSVLAPWDASPAGERALAVAAALALHQGRELIILVPAAGHADFVRGRAEAQHCLRQRSCPVRYVQRERADADTMARLVRELGAGCLVIAHGTQTAPEETVARLLARIDCPLIVSKDGESLER